MMPAQKDEFINALVEDRRFRAQVRAALAVAVSDSAVVPPPDTAPTIPKTPVRTTEAVSPVADRPRRCVYCGGTQGITNSGLDCPANSYGHVFAEDTGDDGLWVRMQVATALGLAPKEGEAGEDGWYSMLHIRPAIEQLQNPPAPEKPAPSYKLQSKLLNSGDFSGIIVTQHPMATVTLPLNTWLLMCSIIQEHENLEHTEAVASTYGGDDDSVQQLLELIRFLTGQR
jgi:hypothetical protein